jgi:hypothetical protein
MKLPDIGTTAAGDPPNAPETAAGAASPGRPLDRRSSPPNAVVLGFPLAPEDRSRADFYALLARLFADAPDAPLLQAIAQAAPIDDTTPFASAWNRLVAASGVMDASAAAQEFTDLFIGVGRCDVNLHGSHWKVGAMMERPLAELRAERPHRKAQLEDDSHRLANHRRQQSGEENAPCHAEQRAACAEHHRFEQQNSRDNASTSADETQARDQRGALRGRGDSGVVDYEESGDQTQRSQAE